MKLVIFTICKDEAQTIGQLLDRMPKKIAGIDTIETLVISDGSQDKTVDISKKRKATKVINGLTQKRLAFRFEQAIETVLEMGADIACNIDGDLQFAPEDIPNIVKPIQAGYDFVAADRFTDPATMQRRKPKGMPAAKYWGNVLGAWTISMLTGQKFRDVTCGFRAYNRSAMLAININGSYTYTQESFQVLAVKKMNITSVPVPVTYYQGRQSRVVKSFGQFIFTSALSILRSFRDYSPLKFFGYAGLFPFTIGVILSAFVIWHWLTTGNITPYKAVGFIGVYAVSVGIILWALGLVADMFDRMLRNQEKVLTEIKKPDWISMLKDNNHIQSIAVIGLGYVGLPLALQAESKGFKVVGIDLDQKKLKKLSAKQPVIDDQIANQRLKNTAITFTSDFAVISKVDAVIVCVPTPVYPDKTPNLNPVKEAVSSIIKHIKAGSLLIIESTINPGVCDEIVIPLIESQTKFKVGKTLHLAHCPERINPGDPNWHVGNINRVIGASNPAGLKLALAFYQQLIDASITPMSNIKEAEACKVVENSFRDINIAFVNELAMSFHVLGINIENVIDGAATKPFSFMPHRPGAGVGGHCIPVDPYYLIEYAHTYGFEHDFLRHARQVNENMPAFTVSLLVESLNEIGQSIKGAKVALLGLSYKANVGDDRESPAYIIRNLLEASEADLVVYDPFIKKGSTAESLEDALDKADAILIATGHNQFKEYLTTTNLLKHNLKIVIDGRNILRQSKNAIADSGIIYQGIGI